ncbi:antiterminator Q family protein [Vibrio gangliei]|uniref:antiterminator Q family protein n=1 Tax=Vibrio gangliei TaxID=2077090 RepID=UPI000D019D55|nr:antiterminator Q family protein [Vibrio gangliei]
MRNLDSVREILYRWGVWSRSRTGVEWYSQSAGMNNVLPVEPDYRPTLCDDDGLIIDQIIASMSQNGLPLMESEVLLHFHYGLSFREIARRKRTNDVRVRILINQAVFYVSGSLVWSGTKLACDNELCEVHQ